MGKEGESLARQVAERVQEAVEAAERQAREIVARAEQEAERIRSSAEAEARERIERAQHAVDRLVRQANELRESVGSLGSEVAGDGGARSEVPAPEVDPTPARVPEPEPAREPEPQPVEIPEPSPPQPAPPGRGSPSTEQLIEQMKGGNAEVEGRDTTTDEQGARLVALKMALDGRPREEVERHLAESLGLRDSGRLLDDVYSRIGG